jgi:hypothetical protein
MSPQIHISFPTRYALSRQQLLIAIIMAVLLGAAILLARTQLQPSKPIADIPIRMVHDLPTTDVIVAGKPLALMIDLGGFAGIALTTAELIGTDVKFLEGSNRYTDIDGREYASRRFVVPEVILGGRSFGALDGSESVFVEGAGPPDNNGYIGFGFLHQFLLVLDYPGGHFRLYSSGDDAAFEAECGRDSFPVESEKGITRSIAKTDRGSLRVLWDTGATVNAIHSALFAVNEQTPDDQGGPPFVSLNSLSLAGREYGPVQFRVTDFAGPPVDGILGTPFLGQRKLCFDLPRGKAAIAPPANAPIKP